MGNIDPISLGTAVARVLILIPLIRFMHAQALNHANGSTHIVRRAVLWVDAGLVLLMGNLAYVNVITAFGLGNGGPLAHARLIALISSVWLMVALWNMWRVFIKVNHQ